MKPNKDFRLTKSSKRMLSTLSKDQRGPWLKMMIEAEMSEKRAKMAKLSGMKSNSNQGE
jgi:hypothetical protein